MNQENDFNTNNSNSQNNNNLYNETFTNQTVNVNEQSQQLDTNLTNEIIQEQPKKKIKIGLIIGVIIIVAIIVFGIIYVPKYINKNSKSGNNINNSSNQSNNKNKKEIKHVYFSNSSDVNNIAIPLRWVKGYYVIKLNDENIGQAYHRDYVKIDNKYYYSIYNDKLEIIKYFNANTDSWVKLYGLWNYEEIDVSIKKYDERLMNGSGYLTCRSFNIIQSQGNYHLVSSSNSCDNNISYYIKYVIEDDVIEIDLGYIDLNTATNIFNSFVNNLEIAFIPLGEDDTLQPAVKSKTSSEPVDISNWTFIQNKMSEIYSKQGIDIIDTTKIEGFNTTSYGLKAEEALYLSPIYKIKDTLYTAGVTIDFIDKNIFDNIINDKDKMNEIKLNQFKRVYITGNSYGSNIYVETNKSKYYRIATGISYSPENPNNEKMINILNKIFN